MFPNRKSRRSTSLIIGLGLAFVAALAVQLYAQPASDTVAPPAAPSNPAVQPPPAPQPQYGARVFIVELHEEVDDNMVLFCNLSIKRAKEGKADYIIFDVDTPGGKMDAMEKIGQGIAALEGITTIAYVDKAAFSAGAYICLSCDKIIMAPASSIGSATPILISPTGIEVSEKMTSAGRALFRSMALAKGHNPDLAEAMVDMTIWVEWYNVVKDGQPAGNLIVRKENFPNEAKRLSAEGKSLEYVEDICTDKQLLNLTYDRAEKYGLSVATCKSFQQIYDTLGLKDPVVKQIELNFTERVFFFLRSPAIIAILTLIGIVGIFSEMSAPGFTVPAIVGISAIGLIILTGYMVGTANLWTGLMVFAGIVLLALEIFVIPGFGIPGIVGIVLIAAGIILSLVPAEWPQLEWEWSYLLKTVGVLVLGGFGALIVLAILTKVLPHTPMLSKLTLATAAGTAEGFVVTSEDLKSLQGQKGVAATKLRPVGKADLGGRQYQVVADGDFIDIGDKVEVIDVTGNSITVRKVE